MIDIDKIYNDDCLEGMKRIADGAVDCIVTDPPYELENQGGGFWSKNEDPAQNHYNARGTRKGMDKLGDIKDGITDDVLDEMCRVMKHINIYIFCSQRQIQQYLDYFVTRRGCNWNLLAWHKTNPIPACGNKYLSDTEFILFFRDKGVKVFGSYDTKRTFYVTLRNQEDNVRYKHPTVKPLQIIRNFVVNSTEMGGVVLDPFIGSGTTAVACLKENRRYIGFELNNGYFDIAQQRIDEIRRNPTLF